jgi:glycosyltransferase involved in cell wall biosynthesis
MRKARVHLVLSLVEGGPMSVLEALASGTPCVTTDVGFCKEIINSNLGVVLKKEPTVVEIRSAIDSAWLMKEQIYSYDLLKGDFTWERFGADLYL